MRLPRLRALAAGSASAREAELRRANLVLRRSIEMHDRLTQAAMGGGGKYSIATAIHEVTGHGAGT